MDQISRHFAANELAPEDVILHRVGAIMKAHPKMQAIFGGPQWIKVTDVPDMLDFGHFPILYVSPFFASSEPQTASYSLDFRLYFVARWEMVGAKELKPGEATVASVARLIHSILETGGNKTLNVPDPSNPSSTIQLVNRNTPGPIRFQFDESPKSGRLIVSQIIERNFTAKTDPTSGRIRNQVIAES